MKNVLNILCLGLRDARFYIESFKLKWRHLIVLMLVGTLFKTISLYQTTKPTTDQLYQDIINVSEYIPEYKVNQSYNLELADGEKPLYYKSNYIQIVIDDTVETKNNTSAVKLPSHKAEAVEKNTPLNLFMFKDQIFFGANDEMTFIDYDQYVLSNSQLFKSLINLIQKNESKISQMSFVMYFVAAAISYLFNIVITALLAGVFNAYLNQRIGFVNRMKLAVIVSLVPLIIVELAKFLLPNVYFGSSIVLLISLALIYRTYRDYSNFIQRIIVEIKKNDGK